MVGARIPGRPEVFCGLVPAWFTLYIIGGCSCCPADYSLEDAPSLGLAITAMNILSWKEKFLLGVVRNIFFLSYLYYAELRAS